MSPMSGPSIQSIAAVQAQAVQTTAPTPGEAVPMTPPPAAALTPPAATGIELDLSELARLLEKLTQVPGIDPRALAQLATLGREQGALLSLLAGMDGTGTMTSQANLPDEVRPLSEAIKRFASQNQQGNATRNAAQQEPGGLQEIRLRIAQAVQNLTATLRDNLLPLLEAASPLDKPTAGTAAAPPRNAAAITESTPQQAPRTGPPVATTTLAQFIQGSCDRVSALLRQLTGQPVTAPLPPTSSALATGETPLVTTGTAVGAAPETMAGKTVTLPAELPPLALMAEVLRHLQSAAHPGAPTLLRQEFIRATLGVVATLLHDPVFTEPQARPASQPIASPAAQTVALKSEADPVTQDRIQAVLRYLGELKGLMTQSGRQAWSRAETLLREIGKALTPQGADKAGLPDRLAAARRYGVTFEIELRDSPRLDAAVGELRHRGLRIEVARTESSRIAVLKFTLPESPANQAPERAATPHQATETVKKNASAVTDKAVPPTEAVQKAGPALIPREAFTPLLFTESPLPPGAGEGVTAPDSDRARPEQYSHPEALRPPPQTRQEAVMVQMVGFFQAHREEMVQGRAFSPEQTAAASTPILAANRLLEYKPIEVLRPPAPAVATAPEPPIIELKPIVVQRAS